MSQANHALSRPEPSTEVEINVALNNSELVIESPDTRIGRLQSVKWSFKDIPSHWIPGILFFDAGGLLQSGPFESIVQEPSSVTGRGNKGRAGDYSYMVMLRDHREPQLSMLFSTPAKLRQQGPPVIQVSVDLAAGKFRVEPLTCRVAPGDSVSWKFQGLDSRSLAEIRFRELTRLGEPAPERETSYFGPFESLTYFEQELEGSGRGLVGKHAYDVHVVSLGESPRGVVLRSAHSDDPIIDNEAEVPPPEWER